MFYFVFYLIILFAGLAMMVREGLWSNTITLITIILAGLCAFGFYSPIVIWLDEMADGEHTYWLDFAVLWALYCFVFVVFRVLTGAASKTRMRFKHPIDPIGGPLVGFIAAWVLAAFTLATFHASPMAKDAFSGKLVAPGDVEIASAVTQPDAAWLRFVDRMSDTNAFGSGSTVDFDAKTWAEIYSKRRAAFEKAPGFVVDRK